MCRVVQASYRRRPTSAARARDLVAAALGDWQMADPPELAQTAVLLADELVTNAVTHARSPVRVVVAAAYGTLEVGVTDLLDRPPRRRRPPVGGDGLSTHGRGLQLVETLADEWGTVSLTVGKQVWFRLDTPTWPWTTACPCGGADLDRVRLGSGRLAHAVPPPWDLPAV